MGTLAAAGARMVRWCLVVVGVGQWRYVMAVLTWGEPGTRLVVAAGELWGQTWLMLG